ncbi:ion transporter [Alteromonas oceanisediminis]|uniref:ion transporter n=1 Tax=Alteromonas oceanisediminis TaxID=2836180 RepID=UPI001BDA1550|nr:ion transporter [Alteromonas oceanisediminis]MBT0587399.1 ion transporter [Alteromonas oceanisediminis]
MLKINKENLKASHEGPWILLDLAMLGLLFLNLLWLIFDGLYGADFVYDFLSEHAPNFTQAYDPIHDNFLLVDLVFISIFLTEFVVRWIAAIVRETYLRWYFFPFIHWYDLVGCIPLGGTRIFRFLRIFSILHRLHKFKIIDLNDTGLFRFIAFYYNVIVEELSDRIVVKVLTDAQQDIAEGSPLIDDITHQVLLPRRPILTHWAASTMNHIGESILHPEHGKVIREHVLSSVGKAVRGNNQISTLKLVPVVGSTIERTLETAVTDIVTQSVINLLSDLTPQQIEQFMDNGLKQESVEELMLDKEVLLVVNEALELVKNYVGEQKWKTELAARRAAHNAPVAPSEPPPL